MYLLILNSKFGFPQLFPLVTINFFAVFESISVLSASSFVSFV